MSVVLFIFQYNLLLILEDYWLQFEEGGGGGGRCWYKYLSKLKRIIN